MEIPSNNPANSFCEGMGKECAKEGIDYVKSIISNFKDKKYLFIGERKTIERVKKQKQSPEFIFYSKFISNKNFGFQIKMGLTLRGLADEKDYERLHHLKEVIKLKYDLEGLHVAQLSQNKIIMKYILHHLEENKDDEKIKEELNIFLENIEQNTFFIQKHHLEKDIVKDIKLKIKVHSPKIFVVSSKGSTRNISEKVFNFFIDNPIENYRHKRYNSDNEDILFLFRSS
jgi:hypothetical protein